MNLFQILHMQVLACRGMPCVCVGLPWCKPLPMKNFMKDRKERKAETMNEKCIVKAHYASRGLDRSSSSSESLILIEGSTLLHNHCMRCSFKENLTF